MEVTPGEILHHKDEIERSAKGIIQIYHIGIVCLTQYVPLIGHDFNFK